MLGPRIWCRTGTNPIGNGYVALLESPWKNSPKSFWKCCCSKVTCGIDTAGLGRRVIRRLLRAEQGFLGGMKVSVNRKSENTFKKESNRIKEGYEEPWAVWRQKSAVCSLHALIDRDDLPFRCFGCEKCLSTSRPDDWRTYRFPLSRRISLSSPFRNLEYDRRLFRARWPLLGTTFRHGYKKANRWRRWWVKKMYVYCL